MSRVVVVTGGTSGIGKEIANHFTKLGDTVVVLSRHVTQLDGQHAFKCDVSIEKSVEEAFMEISKRFTHIDVLVNSAGYGISGASELLPYDSIKQIFNVNVLGVVNCSKHALSIMNKGGKIINIASAMAFFPIPFRTMYAASKSAVVTLSYGMRMELSDYGIGVSVVSPGDVKTNFTKNRVKFFETNEKYGHRIQTATCNLDKREDRRMSPEVVAKAVVKLSNKHRMKPLVIVGFKYKVLYVLQKIFPISWVLSVIDKLLGGYKKQ